MLDVLSYVSSQHRRDFPVADADLLDPNSTSPLALEQGEWVYADADGNMDRVTTSNRTAVQVWTQRGDYGAQALDKVSTLFVGEYEAETDMYDAARTYAIGETLTAKSVTIDGQTRAGLTNNVTGGTDYIVGYVTKTPGDDGKLRFRKVTPQLSAA